MTVGQRKTELHRGPFDGSLDYRAVNTRYDKEVSNLYQAIDKFLQEQRKTREYLNSPENQRRIEQEQARRDAEKMLKEHEKRMKRQADCEREKITGKMAYAMSSACW